ncbi:MAG TPA: hypothetical protein VGR51_03255 [Thermoplasmata archaeon]|nr:hypothetical protein [Thermoplasmata archaeon]
MANTGAGTVSLTIGGTCTNYDAISLSITVPGNGNIVVSAQVYALLDHTNGVEDRLGLIVSDSAGTCGTYPWWWFATIEASEPTQGLTERSGTFMRVFPVTAGTYVFFVDGWMIAGATANDRFQTAAMVAVFYPS